ncbi:uncharacterized protein LOC34622215 [Cyclospora cayetanensis]|uniref:Uncharacterized protein n=2 Tax=Cyclospora cayetanensis TaxID=88456 RepID=A0A1D3D6K5_9EIME|nr:uncharacterized protein LOC34622215 [Cyclospora cayetanensis]OEH79075.1 hypothetical protein cyc_05939 [Cyclospora cayetanensis]
MKPQGEWAFVKPDKEALAKEKTLESLQTEDVMFPAGKLEYAGTNVVKETIKATEDVVKEMRTWLKTGIAPDGTRMMTDEASQWYQDFYQATVQADAEHECLPEGSLVDYYYWNAPYLAHIGNINLVMMHSQVNLRDGTHLPCDRLRESTKAMKNLERMANKRLSAQLRDRNAFVDTAMGPAHRGHPLRKEGLYTRYFWSPLHQRTIEEMKGRFPERIPTVVHEAREHTPSEASS